MDDMLFHDEQIGIQSNTGHCAPYSTYDLRIGPIKRTGRELTCEGSFYIDL